MSSSFILNESLIFKNRLREALNTILLLSDNDFAQDISYRRCHQVLHAKIKKLEEDDDFEGPKFVTDVIPSSNLAKYGRFQYNENRERSYTPSANVTSFHYSYLYKSDAEREPWMLPEVEQVFIHTVYSSSFNFSLYETELEKLEKIDAFNEDGMFGVYPFCCMGEFYKSATCSMEHFYDQSPKKSSRINMGDTMVEDMERNLKSDKDLPHYFNATEQEAVELRSRILCDDIRKFWTKPKLVTKDRLLEVYKSLLDNIFFHEDEYSFVSNPKKNDDTGLQKLVSSIVNLNTKIPKIPTQLQVKEVKATECAKSVEVTCTPHRRLYSDVVQGNKTTERSSKQTSPQSEQSLDETPKTITPSSTMLKIDDTLSSPEFDPLNIDLSSPSTSPSFVDLPANPSTSKVTGTKFSYSDVLSSGSCFPINHFNMPFTTDNPASDNSMHSSPPSSSTATNLNAPSNTSSYQNLFNPVQFVTNPLFANPNYRLTSYPNNSAAYAPPPPPPHQQVPPLHRTPSVNPNSCQQQQQQAPWFVTPYRPTPYGVLLLPQLPNKHRWSSQPVFSAAGAPTQGRQASNGTNVNRSSSNQQVNCYNGGGVYDMSKAKRKPPLLTPINSKFGRSKTPDNMSTASTSKSKAFSKKPSWTSGIPNKILTKPNSDYRIMQRQDAGEAACAKLDSAEMLYPVSCCASEELEKIALREYHSSSNDMFFSEIERQAEEQYDGNPENCCRPPNNSVCVRCTLFVGGLIVHMQSSHSKISHPNHFRLL